MSQRAIADVIGADQATVSRDLRARDADASPEPEPIAEELIAPDPAPITGLDGKTYSPKPNRDKRAAETEVEAREELPRSDFDDDDEEEVDEEEAEIVDAIRCIEMNAEEAAEDAKKVVAYGKVPDDAVKGTLPFSRGYSMEMLRNALDNLHNVIRDLEPLVGGDDRVT